MNSKQVVTPHQLQLNVNNHTETPHKQPISPKNKNASINQSVNKTTS